MKKPKYTRQTKYQLQKIEEQYTVSEIEESVARLSARRKWAIDTLTAKKFRYAQKEVGWMLRMKKSININLRANKKILKSMLRKNRNKPLGVLQRVHSSTKAQTTGVIDHTRGSSQYSVAANSPNKPFDIFTRTHPSTQKEVLDAIRQLPDMVEHLQKAFADVEDGPLKGLLCWRGFIGTTEKTIAGSEGKLLYVKLTTPGPITHRVENKIRNYPWTWVRVSEAYQTYRFLPIE